MKTMKWCDLRIEILLAFVKQNGFIHFVLWGRSYILFSPHKQLLAFHIDSGPEPRVGQPTNNSDPRPQIAALKNSLTFGIFANFGLQFAKFIIEQIAENF